MKRSILILIAVTNVVLCPAQAAPLSTAFTYQGRLTDNGQLVNGTYDFQFRLFDAPTNGAQVPVVLAYPTVAVSNGLFTTGLDFGSNVFNGTTWWLDISLRPSGVSNEYTLLTPRQPLTPVPNALFSVNAAQAAAATTANGVAPSAISSAQLNTPSGPAGGQVLSYNGMSLVWTNASTAAAAWTLNGNDGTTPGANFLGTTDDQPFELKVNGQRALRIEPNTNGAPNLIGGASVNQVDAGVVGATIAGGGGTSFGIMATNRISADFGVIGGGGLNTIETRALESTIGGGARNSIRNGAAAATISGGLLNAINPDAYQAVIGGGYTNLIESGAYSSTIGGGAGNSIQANSYASVIGGGGFHAIRALAGFSTIGGGGGNIIDNGAAGSTVAGGRDNMILSNAFWSSIGGGLQNTIQPDAYRSVIAGGYQNTIQTGSYGSSIGGGVQIAIEANSQSATIGGGLDNAVRAAAQYGTISGGRKNVLGTNASFAVISGGVSNMVVEVGGAIGGGQANQAFQLATIAGGKGNVAAPGGAIGGGLQNTIGADSYYSSIFGGVQNTIGSNSIRATIAGGYDNTIQDNGIEAAIGGGYNNSIGNSAFNATISGGFGNKIRENGNSGTIGGGVQNMIQTNALWGTIPGGFRNLISGSFCLAAGRRAKADHDGTFVWGDSTDDDFSSSVTNEFAVRATGGVRFVSGLDNNGVPVAGASLPAGSGSWTTLSDRNAKTHFAPVNPRELLDRLAQVPIQSWNYKSQSESIRHIGPTAQDFHAAFNVGEDDQHIATVEADGVALAAIQGLNQKLEEKLKEKDTRISALEKQNASLENRLAALEKLALEIKANGPDRSR